MSSRSWAAVDHSPAGQRAAPGRQRAGPLALGCATGHHARPPPGRRPRRRRCQCAKAGPHRPRAPPDCTAAAPLGGHAGHAHGWKCRCTILAIEGPTGELPAQILKRAHGLEVTLAQGGAKHQLAPVQAGLLRDGAGHGAGQHGLGLVHPTPVDGGIQQHSQQQVGQRAGGHNRHPRAQWLGVKGQMALFKRHAAFALIEHLDVAAQRQRANHKFGIGDPFCASAAAACPCPPKSAAPSRHRPRPRGSGHIHESQSAAPGRPKKQQGLATCHSLRAPSTHRCAPPYTTQRWAICASSCATARAWASSASRAASVSGLEGSTAPELQD